MKRTTRLKTEKLVIYKNQVLNFTIAKPIKKKNNFGISKRRVCGLYILYINMTCLWTTCVYILDIKMPFYITDLPICTSHSFPVK
jgi:hypothetical protein